MTSVEWLRQLTHEGARWRHGGRVPEDVEQQLERELELIEELDYPGYFLTMWEIVEYCRARGILCQGRGSAANSAVCYCLGITAVDPERMGLLTVQDMGGTISKMSSGTPADTGPDGYSDHAALRAFFRY